MLSEFLPIGLFFFLWLLGLTFFLVKTLRHYQRLTQGVEKKDLKSLLEEILKRINQKDEETRELFKFTQGLEKEGLKHIQKLGFMRYNPFGNTGGDQSFILTLLDGKDNGVILSSFHGREGTRIYAKSVKAGRGEHFVLSEEEEKVIKEARLKH